RGLRSALPAGRYPAVVDEVRSLVAGAFGTPPAPIDPALERVVQLTADPESEEDVTPPFDEVRERAGGVAASEEELLLLGLFGEDAERLLRGIRGAAPGRTKPPGLTKTGPSGIRGTGQTGQDPAFGRGRTGE